MRKFDIVRVLIYLEIRSPNFKEFNFVFEMKFPFNENDIFSHFLRKKITNFKGI